MARGVSGDSGYEQTFESRDVSDWRLSSEHAYHIYNLVKRATEKLIKKNYGDCYDLWFAIRELINFRLKPKEREGLDAYESKLDSLKPAWKKWNQAMVDTHKIDDKVRTECSDFKINLKKYRRELMDFLKVLGYFPAKEDTSQLGF